MAAETLARIENLFSADEDAMTVISGTANGKITGRNPEGGQHGRYTVRHDPAPDPPARQSSIVGQRRGDMGNGNNRTARERLDAVLTELEQETVTTEDVVATDVAAMRSLIESAIENRARAETERSEAPDRVTAGKGRVASSIERLGRLAGIGQGAGQPSAPRVRIGPSRQRATTRDGSAGATSARVAT